MSLKVEVCIKIIANTPSIRFQRVMGSLVSDTHNAFVSVRQILDSSIVAKGHSSIRNVWGDV